MRAGDVLAGRYRLIARLGEGGMGEVWRGEQTALGRDVAIKLVRTELDAQAAEARERFRREAELAAKVQHRNVVDIVDFGTEEGAQYLVMPLLDGETLHARLERARPSVREVVEWVRGILGGLAAIHDAGIVHRDLKPANVFLAEDADGVIPKLLDFGISRRTAESDATALTAQGAGIGTPHYMAPEQFESARDVDARADVWAVGVILYEALGGRRPFEGDDAFAVYKAVLQTEPTPLGELRPELPAELTTLVHRALERHADARFDDGRAMRDALDALTRSGALGDLASEPSSGVPPTRVMTAGGSNGDPEAAPISGDAPTMPASDSQRLDGDSGSTRSGGDAPTMALGGGEAARAAAHANGGPVGPTMSLAPPDKKGRGAALAIGAVAVLGLGAAVVFLGLRGEPVDEPIATPSIAADATDAGGLGSSDGGPAMSVGGAAPTVGSGYAVSRPQELTELAADWAELPETLRRQPMRFVPEGADHVAVMPGDVAEDARHAIARALSSTPSPRVFDADRGLRPELLRTTARLNLRTRPSDEDDAILRVLPHDGVVVGLHGAVRGQTSTRDGDDAMAYVVVSRRGAGWVSARFLSPMEGCLPSSVDILDHLAEALGGGVDDLGDLEPVPEEEDPWAQAERIVATGITAKTFAYLEGRRQPVFLIASADFDHGESTIVSYRLSGSCEIEPVRMHWIAGVFDEVFLTETLPNGGRTLLVVSYAPRDTHAADGMLEWTARPLDGFGVVWTEQLRTAAGLPDHLQSGVAGTRDRIARRRRDPFALSVRTPRSARRWLVWQDGALVDLAAGEGGGGAEEAGQSADDDGDAPAR